MVGTDGSYCNPASPPNNCQHLLIHPVLWPLQAHSALSRPHPFWSLIDILTFVNHCPVIRSFLYGANLQIFFAVTFSYRLHVHLYICVMISSLWFVILFFDAFSSVHLIWGSVCVNWSLCVASLFPLIFFSLLLYMCLSFLVEFASVTTFEPAVPLLWSLIMQVLLASLA